MSIKIAGEMATKAHREGLREAAAIVDRFADKVMRDAEKAHEAEEYEEYEALEYQATLLTLASHKILNAARRSR